MIKSFKKFMANVNIIELALALFIADTFGKVLILAIHEIVMPFIGLYVERVHASGRFITLNGGHFNTIEEAMKAGAKPVGYGNLLLHIIDYLIVTLIILLVIRNTIKIKRQHDRS